MRVSGVLLAVCVVTMSVRLPAAVALAPGPQPPAPAQAAPTTTTSSTSTPDSAPRGQPAPTTSPAHASTTTTAPATATSALPVPVPVRPAPPAAPMAREPGEPEDDSGPADVPRDAVVVPPADPATPPDPTAPILRQIAGLSLAEASKALARAQSSRAAASNAVGMLTYSVDEYERRVSRLETDKAEAVARMQRSRLELRRRAVAGYVGSAAASLGQLLEATDFNDLTRRVQLLQSVVAADRARIAEHDAARAQIGRELEGVVVDLDAKQSALVAASSILTAADSFLLGRQIQVAAVRAGNIAVGSGFVFPVGGPHSFGDTFGAPRMTGTVYEHTHEGTDIFAVSGTPLRAVERGVIIRVGSDVLGGTKLWLVGASGTRYYYAHLSAFAEGVVENKAVAAGDVIGYVGNTGNALTTPAHVHFEVHPDGGPAVNPHPLLKIVDEAEKRFAALQPRPPATAKAP